MGTFTGRIVGDWAFVWGAYGFSVVVLAFYALSLFFRGRAEARASAVAEEAHRLEQEAAAATAQAMTDRTDRSDRTDRTDRSDPATPAESASATPAKAEDA